MKFTRSTQRHKAVTVIFGLVLCWSVMNPEICAAEPRKSASEQEMEEARTAARVAAQREAALQQKLRKMKQKLNIEGSEIYVVYSGKNYREKQSFLATLPKEFSVKSYNVDRLRAKSSPSIGIAALRSQ